MRKDWQRRYFFIQVRTGRTGQERKGKERKGKERKRKQGGWIHIWFVVCVGSFYFSTDASPRVILHVC